MLAWRQFTGDLVTLERLLADNPELANVQIEGRKGGYRTPLHVVADWPGYFPNGPEVVRLLLAAGTDPNGGREGLGRQETSLDQATRIDTGREALVTWLREWGAHPSVSNREVGRNLPRAALRNDRLRTKPVLDLNQVRVIRRLRSRGSAAQDRQSCVNLAHVRGFSWTSEAETDLYDRLADVLSQTLQLDCFSS